MPRVWRYAPFDESLVRQLTTALRLPPLIAQVLAARGVVRPADADQFLSCKLTDLHDPELLPGIPQAADRIVAAVRNNRRITVYGDYDVDGVTATSLLWHCIRLAGGQVDYYIPSRMEEGYGLNCEALQQLHAEDPARLVVSVDCGICSVAEAARARELGLELIITDHHQFDATLPEATVLVHPRLPGGTYPFADLCGVGVAFKLAWAICTRLGDGKRASPHLREFLLQAIGLAAIGTIADVVPLRGENRVLVQYGLASLLQRATPGLKALLRVANIAEKPVFETEDVGFAIAPRINAAGRLGQARLAVELLTTTDEARATTLAAYLDNLNKNRQQVERRMLKQAKELVEAHPEWLNDRGLVLSHDEWHPGVIGIVAGRVAEHFERPAVMIAINPQMGLGQGSARTYHAVDLHASLTQCKEHLVQFGGHHAAAGLRIEPLRIPAFREAFRQAVAAAQGTAEPEAELRIDAEVRLDDVTLQAVNDLTRLGPFGATHPRPIFAATGIEVVGQPRTMGEGDRHLSVTFRQGKRSFRSVAFGRGEWAAELASAGVPLAICFQPLINRFRGQENVELQLLDWQPATLPAATRECSAEA